MNFSAIKGLAIPDGVVTKITLAGKTLWEAITYTNWVPLSTTDDGKTIYNGGLGYKNGYRVRSGGAEAALAGSFCTGYIPVKGGEIIRIQGWGRYVDPGSASNAINAADASFTNIGQVGNSSYGIFLGDYKAYNSATIKDYADAPSEWVVPPAASGIAYIRVSGYSPAALDGKDCIITINEEIT